MSSQEHYLSTHPKSVRRLVRALQYSGTQATPTFLNHVSHVARLPDFNDALYALILGCILDAPRAPLRAACFSTLIDARPDFAQPDELAHAVIMRSRYDLAPILKEKNLIPSTVSQNDQTGIVLALRDQWSYPDILCPDIFMNSDHVRMLAQTLFPRVGSPKDAARLSRILELPMHSDARQFFTECLVDQGASPLGAGRLYNGLCHDGGMIGGLLIRHNLIDIPQLFEDLNQHPKALDAITQCQAWLLNQTTAPVAVEPKRPRL